MIIINDKRIVILTPPKCGSTFLGDAVEGHLITTENNNDNSPHDVHGMKVPGVCRDFKILMVCRNPYDRLVSLYFEMCRQQMKQGKASHGFADFASSLIQLHAKHNWFYGFSVMDFLLHFKKINLTDRPEMVRIENIESDLACHGIELKSGGRPHESDRNGWEYYLPVGELRQGIRDWYHPDFALGNYSKETGWINQPKIHKRTGKPIIQKGVKW